MRISIWWAVGAFALFVLTSGVGMGTWLDAKQKEQALLDSLHDAQQRTSIWQARAAEERVVYRRDTVRVTRWATRYDTVRAGLDSILAAADSGDTSVVPFPIVASLVHAADSTVAACRSLVTSAGRALTACDSVAASLTTERDTYKKLYQTVKPSRWDRIKPWVMLGAGFYVGAKLRVR